MSLQGKIDILFKFYDEKCKIVAIYAFLSGKFLDFRKYACVKDLTNIMSVYNFSTIQYIFLKLGVGKMSI